MTVYAEQRCCQELVELVSDYLEDALSEEETARFEAHIGGCDGCNVYLDQIRQTIAIVGGLSVDALTPEAESALLNAFRGWHSN